LIDYSARVTCALQDLLLSLSHADARTSRADAAAKTLALIGQPTVNVSQSN